jgi:hypothetical protein
MRMSKMKEYNQYRAMQDRTIENVQVEHLARKFDMSKESRIAHLLVKHINQKVDELEGHLGVLRVRPFELYYRYKQKQLTLPLLKPEYVQLLVQGKPFSTVRKEIERTCLARLRTIDPDAGRRTLYRLINPWALARYRGPSTYASLLQKQVQSLNQEDSKEWMRRLKGIRPCLPSQRMSIYDISVHEPTLKKLIRYVQNEAGMGEAVSRSLVEEVITLRNLFCPLASQLNSGEMPIIATHVRAHLSEEIATRFRRHAPVIITVTLAEEIKTIEKGRYSTDIAIESLKERIVRVAFEAYRQNGLLSLMDMQWIFQLASTRIGEIIRSFQCEHNIIVPTPGTILDAGRSLTHKDIVVNLHLQGHTVKEISKITYHSPRAVDNYIGVFEAVLILYLYKIPPLLMARVLRKGLTLINEHLRLAKIFLKSREEILNHLDNKGIKICSIIS